MPIRWQVIRHARPPTQQLPPPLSACGRPRCASTARPRFDVRARLQEEFSIRSSRMCVAVCGQKRFLQQAHVLCRVRLETCPTALGKILCSRARSTREWSVAQAIPPARARECSLGSSPAGSGGAASAGARGRFFANPGLKSVSVEASGSLSAGPGKAGVPNVARSSRAREVRGGIDFTLLQDAGTFHISEILALRGPGADRSGAE